MKKIILTLVFMAISLMVFAVDAKEILDKVDNNETYETIKFEGEMIIYLQGKKIEKSFSAVAKGKDNFFLEFNNPDDTGTKYMKKNGKLYVYTLDLEEPMAITGHMLKESMMGSDLSYEDTVDNLTLNEQYHAKIIEETELDGRPVWVIDLKAKTKTISYARRKIWVDKETYNGIKMELFALSGTKLKVFKTNKIEKIKNKNYPVEQEIIDLQRKDSKTVFINKNVDLNVKVPDNVFSLRNLER